MTEETKAYEIEELDEIVRRGALEFTHRIKRNFPTTYYHPVEKLEDDTYRTQEVTLEAGSTVMLFLDEETAQESLAILEEEMV